MATPIKYSFGEFSPEEFSPEEFFVGFENPSEESTDLNCDKLFLYPKPHVQGQREIDYNLLFDYVSTDLANSSNTIISKVEIGKNPLYELEFSKQTKYLIDLLLLFKEQLKENPTIENYILLFGTYGISCINTRFSKYFKKPKYIKQMLKLLDISSLIELPENIYQLQGELDIDPIYYIAEL